MGEPACAAIAAARARGGRVVAVGTTVVRSLEAAAANVDTWKTVVPSEAVIAGYYFQAINADAPHPAAARLWQEFLYSDEGQNLWLKGGARPVRFDAMKTAVAQDAVTGKIETVL